MNKSSSYKRSLLISISLLLTAGQLTAQVSVNNPNMVSVTGWSDDTHYLIRNLDVNNNLLTYKVDIKTGSRTVVPATRSDRELLIESLPSGISVGMNDVISPDMKSVVISKDNDLYFFTRGDKELKRLTNDKAGEVNTRFSPDGKKIAYTKNKDLYVFDLSANKEIRLTTDASDKIYNGYSSWVYMEEILERRSHYAAFWWSPDGNKIAYLRTDETDVPVFTLNRLDEADGDSWTY